MRFPYLPYEIAGSSVAEKKYVYRPVIPVHLAGSQGTAVILGLADTGADSTLLPDVGRQGSGFLRAET